MTQREFLSSLLEKNKDAVIIGSLGTICYDLDALIPGKYFPFRGAMGCVLGVGLGYALFTHKKVIVIIGDGSFLMKMGSIATILEYKPANLEVHIIQNDVYASTGNQNIHFDTIKDYIPKEFIVHKI